MQSYLGVDLGAESGRVIAGLWDGKRIRLKELHRFANVPVEINGSLYWNVPGLWADIQNGLRAANRLRPGRIQSIGVDTWGVDYVLLSKAGELLGLPHHYRDSRTRGQMPKAFRQVSRREIFAHTGVQFMELNTLYQLLALKRNAPELLSATSCFLMMPDYFHWCLSGAQVSEFTDATTTQFFNPIKRTWSHHLFKRFGLPTKVFPPIVAPGTPIGKLTREVATRVGLDRIRVIAPASHDTGSAVAAVPVSHKRGTWAYLSSGTWSLMGVELDHADLSEKVLKFNFTNEGGVDGTYRLLKNISGLWLVQLCRRAFESRGGKWDYPKLVQLAAKATPLRSLIDPDDASFVNPTDMPNAIRFFCRKTGQAEPDSEGALIRCILESLALKYQQTLTCLEEITGAALDVIHIVGGGSKNLLLNQFTADACQRNVYAGPVEATVLGNVLLQARACGELSSLREIREVVQKSTQVHHFEPAPKMKVVWEEARNRFAKLLKH